MNAALKHWKEAATLIVTAGRRVRAPQAAGPAPHLARRSGCDYDVLLLKRSGKSGFMPNAYVFPGGLVDPSDFSDEWLDIFESFRNAPNFGLRSVKQPLETRPPIFATDRHTLGSSVPGDVAFRICALRETFEECGVLLIVPKLGGAEEARCAGDRVPRYKANQLCSDELGRWRTLVNQDPSNFIRMCRELEVLPNIWALHEWSNWLTPEGRYGAKRFDTAFYMCCLQDVPHTLQDQKEIVRFEWSTPSEILQSYQKQEFWIAPPQFYELSRLRRFPLLSDLHSFARRRAAEGCERWLPVGFLQDGHYISLLPGDKLYPSDSSGELKGDLRADTQEGDDLHRIIISDAYVGTIKITITPKYDHVLPVLDPASSETSKSHL
ncbi:nucleoside diphosphate-linked moiety X motif 19 [Betta splendens]|uniref:Acyl-coenzyme A diphosphatase NUDT19 n=1 Tax=Betta splendens TaxID=158456 RepID=A0A6P7M128_BETSP|nr:nucleoside diphosphate-linked moiety X motif 19 [Betta splendens]